jgi:acyl carrier protein
VTEREQIREYLLQLLRKREPDVETLRDGDSLVLSGRLTSVDVVETLEFLETTFGFSIDPNEFDQEQFDSVDTVVAMLESGGPAV